MLHRAAFQKVILTAIFLLFNLTPALTAKADANAWTDIGLHGGAYYAIAPRSDAPATLYAGAGNSGVLKTTDGGQHWHFANAGLPQNSSLSYPFVNVIAMDPITPSTVYIGTSEGIFRSTTDPESWSSLNDGLTNPNIGYNDFAIDPADPATLYAGTQGGVFKSTTSGSEWKIASSGLTNLSISALAVDPLNSLYVYAGTIGGGLFKSVDGGANWNSANSVDMAGTHIYVIAIDPGTPSTLYAGTIGNGMFKSTNSGTDWNLITGPYAYITGIAINPDNPSIVYYGNGYSGVYKSTNGGDIWDDFNAGLTDLLINTLVMDPSGQHALFAGTENTIFAASLSELNQRIYLPILYRMP